MANPSLYEVVVDIESGSAESLGQKVSAESVPVVLASDQSALPITLAAGMAIKDGDSSVLADVLDLTNANPLTVAIVDSSGTQITSFGGGTQFADGAARGTAIGTLGMVDDGTLIQSMSGDSSGRPNINLISGQTMITGAAGAVAANTPRVTLASDDPAVASLSVLDDWDETDRAKVNIIAGQVGVQGGSGTTNALTQRVVLATDVALPTGANVIGQVTANAGTNLNTSALALSATQTDGTQKSIVRGGAKGATTAADVTSTSQSADRNALDVQIRTSAGVVVDTFGGGTQFADGAARGTATGTLSMVDDGTLIQSMSGDSSGRPNVNIATALPTGANVIGAVTQSGTWTVTANAGTNLNTSALALSATQTDGTQKSIVRGGAKGATTAADITSTSQSADRNAMDVQIRTSAGVVVDTFGGGTQFADGAARGTATGTLCMVDDGTLIQSMSGDSSGRPNVNINGTVTVDTELPAASALSANMANPTTPLVGSCLMGFDGTNWDRMFVNTPSSDGLGASSLQGLIVSNANYAFDGTDFDRVRLEGSLLGLMVGGSTADDAAEAGNPVSTGLTARQTNRTPVADGDRVRAIGDDIGRLVVVHGQVRDLIVQQTTDITTTTQTTILTAAASTFHDLVSLDISNTSQVSVTILIKDTTSGTTMMTVGLAPKQTLLKSWTRPFKQTTVNTNWTATLSVAANVSITVQAEKNV